MEVSQTPVVDTAQKKKTQMVEIQENSRLVLVARVVLVHQASKVVEKH